MPQQEAIKTRWAIAALDPVQTFVVRTLHSFIER